MPGRFAGAGGAGRRHAGKALRNSRAQVDSHLFERTTAVALQSSAVPRTPRTDM
jgi:hypothetical protein